MTHDRDPKETPAGQPVIRPALARGDGGALARRLEGTGSRPRPRPPEEGDEASSVRNRPIDDHGEVSGVRRRPIDDRSEVSGSQPRARPEPLGESLGEPTATPTPAAAPPRPRGRGLQAIPFAAAASPEGSLPRQRPAFDEPSGLARRPTGSFDEPSGIARRLTPEGSLPRQRPAFDEPSALRRRPVPEPLDPPREPEGSLPRHRPAFDEPSALRRRPMPEPLDPPIAPSGPRTSLDPALPAPGNAPSARQGGGAAAPKAGSDVLLDALFKDDKAEAASPAPGPPTKAQLERRRRQRRELLPVLGVVVALVGVAFLGPPRAAVIPDDEARVLTQTWLAAGAASSGLRPSTEGPVAASVDRIARSLQTGMVGLLAPPELHAVVVTGGAGPMSLALPDGTVVVNEALLRMVRSEAELAAVVAHGLAHVMLGHVAQQITPSLPAVRKARGSGAQGAAAALLTTALSVPLAPDDEQEIDRLVLRLVRTAGYNQRHYGQALQHALEPAPSPWAALHGFDQARVTSMAQLDENGRSGKTEYARDVLSRVGP